MGVPRPEFSSSRRLTAQEAAQLAEAVLARAGAACRAGPPPARPQLARAQASAPRRALAARPAARRVSPTWALAEWIVVAGTALVCVAGWLVQQLG